MWHRFGFFAFLMGAPLISASPAAHLTMMVSKDSSSTPIASDASTNPSDFADDLNDQGTALADDLKDGGTVLADGLKDQGTALADGLKDQGTVLAADLAGSTLLDTAADLAGSTLLDTAADLAGSTLPDTTARPSTSSSGGWHMSPVTVVQARIQGDAPVWNKNAKMWLSKFGDTTELAYMNNLDTVNTASVEGALMFVQAEGINVNEQSVKCERKNKMQYVVFYEVTIVQPTYGIKYYEKHMPPEYGEFVAMDTAKCTDVNSDLSVNCKVYYGLDGEPDIGPMVGSNLQTSDPRAPYLGNYWFSYPSSCAQKLREEKTEKCRAEYPGGLCPMGVKPDGDKCTFSYRILGYLNIDDLVGITDMGYKNYSAFCEDGGVEFKALNTGSGFKVEESIDFWKKPGDEKANSNRTRSMVNLYNKLASKDSSSNMEPLPTIEKLTAANPKCYENSKACATSQYGCSRTLYSQICLVCNSSISGCEVAPSTFSFPELELPANSPKDRSSDPGTSGSSSSPMTASLVSVLVAVFISSLL